MGFNPFKMASYLTGPGAIIGGSKWLNSKPKGAQDVNKALTNRLGDLMGSPKGISQRSKNAGFGLPSEGPSLKGMMGNFQQDYDLSRSRSNQLFDENSNIFRSFMGANGGIDPSRIANIDSDIAGFRNIGKYGADSAENANRIRGNGVFEEFSKTGGYSDEDKANIRARATSVIPSFYGSLKKDLDRTNTVQGGFNPGYTSQMSKLTRDRGREAQGAARDAELGIMDRVNEGRRWGTEGMSASEQAIVKNMLAGLSGASNTEMGLADMIRQGQMFGAQGMEGLRTNPGADLAYSNQMLKALGMQDDQINQILGMMSGRNPNQSNFDKYGPMIMQGASAILGM